MKLLQRIVDARQVDDKSRSSLINVIRQGEERARLGKVASLRAVDRKQTQLAVDNQRMAVKLFSQKPTYQIMDMERRYVEQAQIRRQVSKTIA